MQFSLVSAKAASPSDVLRFFSLLESLSFITDTQTPSHSLTGTISLARTYGLTSYDAAYLELAIRENLVLATLDAALHKAAQSGRSKDIHLTDFLTLWLGTGAEPRVSESEAVKNSATAS
jgi:predicted nucleic acid-binding protein